MTDNPLEFVADFLPVFRGLLMAEFTILALLAFSFLFVEPGSGAHAIAIVTGGIVVVTITLIGGVLLLYQRFE